MIFVYLTKSGGLALSATRPAPSVLHWCVCSGQRTSRHAARATNGRVA
jgi:hypothetical protein